MTENLEILWEKVKKSDPKAWRQVIELYSGLVNTVARKAGLMTLDAEDCGQYVWMTLYRKRNTIHDPVALPAWLIKTTYRRAATIARRLKPDLELEAALPLSDTGELPDEIVTQLENEAILDCALKQLDPRCRRLLHELFYRSGELSYRDIAKSLNILPNSLGPLRSRCLVKLKKNLENMGYELD